MRHWLDRLRFDISPDGRTLAVGIGSLGREKWGEGKTKWGEVRIYSVKSGTEKSRIGRFKTMIRRVLFSPTGRQLVVVRQLVDGKTIDLVTVWDLEDKQLSKSLRGHADDVVGVAFADGGAALLTACLDGTVRLWDIRTGREVRRFLHTS